MRLLLVALVLSASALAQAPPEATVHAVPFGSRGNAVELAVGASGGSGSLTVAVVEAPSWLRFASPEAPVTPAAPATADVASTDPVGRLSFDVGREATVGVPVAVVVEVRHGATVRARHTVWLSVSAPPLALEAPRPNPSRGRVAVPFTVGAEGAVRVSVHDVLGREVAVLAEGARDAGAHTAEIAAGTLASGVYLVRLVSGGEARARALTVVR